MTGQPDTRTGLNADHVTFLARLIDLAAQAGVTITYCCYNLGWSLMTSPELDDEAGAALLTALDAGPVGEPATYGISRVILAGRDVGGVRLHVRPLPTTDTTEENK